MEEDLLKIVSHYGINNQLRKFNEECFELIEAIITYQKLYDESCRSGVSVSKFAEEREHIIEEMGDVTVILGELKKYYCITDEDLEKIRKFKVARQLERIKNETAAKNE